MNITESDIVAALDAVHGALFELGAVAEGVIDPKDGRNQAVNENLDKLTDILLRWQEP